MERLQKVIAGAGFTSRRKAEDLIREGRVTVNGEKATLGMQVDADVDIVEIDGRLLKKARRRTIVLYKPLHTVTTLYDPQGRQTVRDLITDIPERLHPVGRLDYMTRGVLLLTNDGELTEKLLHPRYGIEKEYEARVEGEPTDGIIRRLKTGIVLEDGWVKPKDVGYQGQTVRIVLTEGRKHIVRRLLAAVGLPVRELTRLRFATIELEGLKPGAWRDLTPKELGSLKQLTAMSQPRHKPSP
ncbi:MAG: rRNA pseudouridine synthase [Candidatus Carbobacillus altaicus]|nr:rRNA pseudouridine synthase [Candidatus Carbobacillus altaicus]